jgi:hypothetical protein
MIPLYDTQISVLVRSSQWTVSLLQFHLQGDIASEVFLLTHSCNGVVTSDLYHFGSVAKQKFHHWISFYSLLYEEGYVVERVEL